MFVTLTRNTSAGLLVALSALLTLIAPARGSFLPVSLAAGRSSLALSAGALQPLPRESAHGSFGGSFALSADGEEALVAEGSDAAVFVRVGGAWSREAQLRLEGAMGGEGTQVALSADGDTAVLAGPSAPGPVAAWVFTRTGATWTAQGAPLIAAGASPRPPGNRGEVEGFATSVAISASGETVMVGADWDTAHTGAAWVFRRSASAWSEQGPKLTASSQSSEERFGQSVALSADGETALIGAPSNTERPTEGSPPPGAAYLFSGLGGARGQTAKLTSGERESGYGLGAAVALSADASTALLGEHDEARVFTKGASGWQQHRPPLTPYAGQRNSLYYGPDAFGDVLALSADGATALIGGLAETGCGRYMEGACSSTATVWTFRRNGETWVRQPRALVRALPFGSPLALSADGETALIGRGAQFEGVTPVGSAVFVAQLAPAPTRGFVTEAITTLFDGAFEQQLWSATAGTYRMSARVRAPRLPRRSALRHASRHRFASSLMLYGTATAVAHGPENVTLSIRPSALMRGYLRQRRHLTAIVTLEARPLGAPAARKTFKFDIKLIKLPPPEV